MEQPVNQKFSLLQLGSSSFLSPKHRGKKLGYLVCQWQVYINKLSQQLSYKCDRGRVKRNWLEGLSHKPGFYSLCFFQLVYWLEQRKIPLFPRFLAFCWWFLTNLDFYPEHRIGQKDHGCSSILGNFIVTPIVGLPEQIKPKVLQHLQILAIPCWRTRDGNIWVEIRDVNVALLVHNTIKQHTAKHNELVELLQHCWNKDVSR